MATDLDTQIKRILGAVLKRDSIPDDLTPHTAELWDSVSHMYIVFALEDEFGITLTEDQMITMMDGYQAIVATVTECMALNAQ